MMAAVANGGVMWKPRLVQRVERSDGSLAYGSSSQMTERVDLSPVVWGFLRHSLAAVVKDGTGALARVPGVEIAGKTGTAQTISKSDFQGQDHAWFASFAPADDPSTSWWCWWSGAARVARSRPRSRGRSTKPSSSRRWPR
jgi:cell division protein FtsI/penicillin-binding protein 2